MSGGEAKYEKVDPQAKGFEAVKRAFANQVAYCRDNGAPVTAEICEALLGLLDPMMAVAFFFVSVVFGCVLSLGTLALEEQQLRRTPNAKDLLRLGAAAVLENFGYRQINLWYRMAGIRRYFRNDTSWAAVPRVGLGKS